jgi:hypothetical protein
MTCYVLDTPCQLFPRLKHPNGYMLVLNVTRRFRAKVNLLSICALTQANVLLCAIGPTAILRLQRQAI